MATGSEEERWQDQYSFKTLCQVTETVEVQNQLWSQNCSLEVVSGLVLQMQRRLLSEHKQLKISRQLTATKKYYLAPSQALHLLTPSRLETHVRRAIEMLQKDNEFLEHFVNELTRFSSLAQTLQPQMRYLQFCYAQHLASMMSIMKWQTELFVTTDL